mmetsp:Transcript_44087/g.141357  ORF Transcript_44087/g.141357 Transcript_44087/m.141357 type:complete len:253 (+) Transcript_44087:1813-2571(+)
MFVAPHHASHQHERRADLMGTHQGAHLWQHRILGPQHTWRVVDGERNIALDARELLHIEVRQRAVRVRDAGTIRHGAAREEGADQDRHGALSEDASVRRHERGLTCCDQLGNRHFQVGALAKQDRRGDTKAGHVRSRGLALERNALWAEEHLRLRSLPVGLPRLLLREEEVLKLHAPANVQAEAPEGAVQAGLGAPVHRSAPEGRLRGRRPLLKLDLPALRQQDRGGRPGAIEGRTSKVLGLKEPALRPVVL